MSLVKISKEYGVYTAKGYRIGAICEIDEQFHFFPEDKDQFGLETLEDIAAIIRRLESGDEDVVNYT